MAKRQMRFTFPEEQLREPIVYNLSHQFEIVTNIRLADITEDQGWVTLELEGENEEIERGIAWVTSRGVRVDPITEDNISS